jgi:large subunit ribosomal protein LP2
MATADDFRKEFMDNVEENITCSKCKKVPRNATVSWCSAHHLMCQSCHESKRYLTKKYCEHYGHYGPIYPGGQSCGTCPPCVQAKIVQCGATCNVSNAPALSPFLANVLKMFPTKCKFTHNGCQVFIALKELEVHEVDCVYRNINCPFVDCKSQNVSFIGLGEHLEANHGNLKKISKARSKESIPMLDQQPPVVWIPQELAFRNRSFFTEVHRDAALKSRHFWIYFHGTPEEAVHYSYRIKIVGANGKELMFKGNVYSLDETKKAILAKEDVIIQYDNQVKRLEVDGQINFEITLYSDKEEIKDEDVESGISDDEEDVSCPRELMCEGLEKLATKPSGGGAAAAAAPAGDAAPAAAKAEAKEEEKEESDDDMLFGIFD